LAQLFIPLLVIPIPVIIFFGALALPIRKDQPMEVYMAAILSFYIKPRKRLWESDGVESLIEITAPKTIDIQRTKDISVNEAQRRFSYLAEIVDSQGWAVRGAGVQAPNNAMKSDVYFEAQQVQDVLDNDNVVAQSLNYKLDQSDARRHQQMVNIVQGQPATPNYFNNITTPLEPVNGPSVSEKIDYNPYPESIQQAVIQPINPNEQLQNTSPTTSEKVATADILNLASNSDLSIEAIAREANRINKKLDSSQEVVVSLR